MKIEVKGSLVKVVDGVITIETDQEWINVNRPK